MRGFVKLHAAAALAVLSVLGGGRTAAGGIVEFTVESAVEIAMRNSYRIKQLELGIEKRRWELKSERASLKSKVYMNMTLPRINAVSDYRWNSTLMRDEIVRRNTRRWQLDLSVMQPVILFGHPTNGYLSLNNTTYRYLQKAESGRDVDYYNRLFLKFEQPFMQPNNLKNDIEDAELKLRAEELSYMRNRVNLAGETAREFYRLFLMIYRDGIYARTMANLEAALEAAGAIAESEPKREAEKLRLEVELANVTETRKKNLSELRLARIRAKNRLRIDVHDSLDVEHTIEIGALDVDFDRALQYCYTLRPHLRLLEIERRRREIRLDESRGWDSFRVKFEATFGLEKNHDRYQAMWEKYDNSWSFSLSAYIPIWDWGRHKAWVDAQRVSVRMADLSIEETRESLRSALRNVLADLEDYRGRAEFLEKSADDAAALTEASLRRYRNGELTLQALLKVIYSQTETESNFIDAYIGYKNQLEELKMLTYYDFETGVSLLDRFRPKR